MKVLPHYFSYAFQKNNAQFRYFFSNKGIYIITYNLLFVSDCVYNSV
jgi:hypothetical protein